MAKNLNDAGAGSLRQALLDADAAPGTGTQLINFTVAGTIHLTSGALPPITRPVNVDGTTAPNFSQKQEPLVEIDDNGFGGLQFNTGSAGSALRSLAIDNAGSDGVTLNDSDILVVGNYIGVGLDGSTVAGNAGNGLVINSTSTGNTIGATATVAANTVISLASNVISGNHGNGIAIHGSSGNTIVANYIGTDVTGLVARGNGGSGILLDTGATQNTIGGIIPFVNTSNQVPDSNLISGNAGDGVLITGASSSNTLAANFIGTNLTGNAPLGNSLDGVGITGGSNGNVLTGTTFTQNPFIYANIVSGNLGNGLVISNSNNATIQADIFGLGYNNQTPVGNALDGVLIEGTSANTQLGGVIPLGNVDAANGGNGVEITGTVSGTVVFNTFCGLAAFEDYSNLGNGLDGMLISSTGGNTQIRTNVIDDNHFNGIEITGEATGVQVTEAEIGVNTNGSLALPNGSNGILIDGDAHGNVIGGLQPSVIPQNTISGNLGHGVAITGTAHDNTVVHSDIGTDVLGRFAIGNAGAGIFLASGTYANTIGGTAVGDPNVISGNLGNGIELSATSGNIVSGNLIGVQGQTQAQAVLLPLLNGGSGIFIDGGTSNTIGGTTAAAANVIAYNGSAGVFVNTGSGNAILGNSIYNNQNAGIVLQPGANGNQKAPRLTKAMRSRHRTVIRGKLVSAPNSTYHVEFFVNTSVAPSHAASGQTLVGSATVITNSRGIGTIAFVGPNTSMKAFFTATATSAANNTSAFSNSVRGR